MKNHSSFLCTLVLCIFLLGSCSKNDSKPPRTTHKGVLKISVSEGSSIIVASFGTEKGTEIVSGLSGTTYTSPEFDIPSDAESAIGGGSATGKDVNSTIKVELYIDGELKKEGNGSGTALISTAQYSF